MTQKRYAVTIRQHNKFLIFVEASDEDQAIERAFDKYEDSPGLIPETSVADIEESEIELVQREYDE
jgi:hypothetical protein